MKQTDYSSLSTAALLKIRGRTPPGSEEDRAVEAELAQRQHAPRLSKETRRQIPILFTASEWAATREREGP